MAFKFNIFTGNLDVVNDPPDQYIDGDVEYHSSLPVSIGSPAVNSAFLVRKGEGLYFISRKPAGIWVRELNNGNLDDWKYAGTFSDLYRDANFRIINDTDTSKELAFSLSGISNGTTRTLTVPNASGTIGWLQSVSSITVSSTHQLTAARNQRVLVNSTGSAPGTAVYLPSTGNAEGDRLEVACVGLTAGALSVRTGQYDFTVSTSMGLNEQRTFIYTAGAWTVGTVESHTHSGLWPIPAFPSSDFRVTQLINTIPTNLAFSLSGLTAGSTRTLTVPDASGRIQVEGQPIGSTTRNTGAFTTLNANNGTITASAPVLDLSQTWNASGVTFTGLTFNVTNTASAATSRVFNFLIGGTSRMAMNPSGDVLIGTGLTLRGDGLVNSSLAVICGTNVGINNNDLRMRSTLPIQWSSTSSMDGTADLFLRRDAAGALAQYNGTNAQESRLYGTFTSSTNYQRMTIKSVRQTLSALSGASATTTGTFIPDGAVVVGVTTRVATLLTGATGYTIGDGTDADRWGDINATAVGTTSDNANWTAGTIECFTAGGEITLTAKTSDFTGGSITICVFYLAGEAD